MTSNTRVGYTTTVADRAWCGIECACVLTYADKPSSVRDPGLTQQTTIGPRWPFLSCPRKVSFPSLPQRCPYPQLRNPWSVLSLEHSMHSIDCVQPQE